MIRDPNYSDPAAIAPADPDVREGLAGQGDEDALRLWVVLARTHQTMVRAVSNRVSDDGLTLSQFGILEALYHLGPLSLSELAEKLLVTGGNVTYVMDRLEEQGFVYRQRSDLDRRVIEARLTQKGEALVAELFPTHAHFLGTLIDHLDPDEQRTLRVLLKRLGRGAAEKLRAGATEAPPSTNP